MSPSVIESWRRIERWLAAHAPVTFAALAPPAEPAGIAAAEAAIGLPFPEPLRESLLRHDGTGCGVLLPPYWMLLTASDIADIWRMRVEIDERESARYIHPDAEAEEVDPDADFGPWWDRRWIPFAQDGCGDELVIDLRSTARRGRIGEADHEQGCFFERHAMWASLPVLLDATATALETGARLDGYERFVTPEGELDWEIL